MEADHLAVLQTGHVLRHALAAAGAGEGGEDAGLFRQGLLGLSDGEQLLQRRGQNLLLALLPAEGRLVPLRNHPEAFAGGTVIKGVGGLAGEVVDEIPLAQGAAQQGLNGVAGAGVGLGNADQLLVRGGGMAQPRLSEFAQPHAQGQTRALVAVEDHCFFPHGLIHSGTPPRE